jgi:hypothetical protein
VSVEADEPVVVLDDPPASPIATPYTALTQPATQGSSRRLFGFALANVRRRPERAVLAVAGIALAISAAVVMRTIASGYEVSGVSAVHDAIDSAPYWVVPETGVRVDPGTGVVVADGPPPSVGAPDGWTANRVIVGDLPGRTNVALVGRTDVPDGVALVSATAMKRLGVNDGDPLDVAGVSLRVQQVSGAGSRVTVTANTAASAGVTDGWLTLTPPAGEAGSNDEVAAATGLMVTDDPAYHPQVHADGLVYSTAKSTGRFGFISFDQKVAAMLGSKVSSSVLGLISNVALALGFIIAVSTFVASVQERRREFGIMASIGLTDEVLYFFLVESLLLFVAAYVLGVVVGGAIVAGAASSFFTFGAWLQAAGLVAMYLPALGIVAALVPVHRLLQQRPVTLLADNP